MDFYFFRWIFIFFLWIFIFITYQNILRIILGFSEGEITSFFLMSYLIFLN